jgi:hypothetical protein
MHDNQLLGPTSFGNAEYVGSFNIPAPPKERKRRLLLPASLIEREASGERLINLTVGDSMQPTILDNDILVIDPHRAPAVNDIVVVADGDDRRMVARLADRRMLVKDNRRFAHWSKPLGAYALVGVMTARLHRQYRRKAENWRAIHNTLATLGSDSKVKRDDVGYLRSEMLDRLRGALDIPKSELVAGRLPVGLFRARTKEDHPHLGISRGEWLTLNPTREAKRNDIVYSVNNDGALVAGVLRRDVEIVRGLTEYVWRLGEIPGHREMRIDNARTDGIICAVEAVS